MNIRSITLFSDPSVDIKLMSDFFSAAREAYHLTVQTVRQATKPFPDWIGSSIPMDDAIALGRSWLDAGSDYVSFGPVLLDHPVQWLEMTPELISADHRFSTSAEIANRNSAIDIERCHRVSQTIIAISQVRSNGFGNFGFGALANCRPGYPFFPVAYHEGGPPNFAIAMEAADMALKAIEGAQTINEARRSIVSTIESESALIAHVSEELAHAFDLSFAGIDFSLAPYPERSRSLGSALEALGISSMGAPGGLFSAAFLADALDRAQFPRAGFNGLMMPVLEDALVAERVAQGQIDINKMLTYSALCGVGLDIVPLPGDVDPDVLTGILLDVAALSLRLDKPLTARLLPIPDLGPGQSTNFDFEYFTNSRAMTLPEKGVSGKLKQPEKINLRPMRRRFND
jgi:uncharacterized protein (UPF0210 family)